MNDHWPVVACTGHRHLTSATGKWLRVELIRVAGNLRDHNRTVEAITGMAIGADHLWAWAAHAAGIPYAAYLPFVEQPDRWNSNQRGEWRELRKLAAREVIVGDLDGLTGSARDAKVVQLLHARNDVMLRDADAIVAVWDGRRDGGTWSAVQKAHRAGMPIIHVNPATRTTRLGLDFATRATR